MLFLFIRDVENNRWEAEISATRSDYSTVKDQNIIRNYLLRVEEFSRRWSF